MQVYIGNDFGGTATAVKVLDGSGQEVILPMPVEEPSLTDSGPEYSAGQIVVGVGRALKSLGLTFDNVAGLGSTFPGYITPEGTVGFAPNLRNPLWPNYNFVRAVGNELERVAGRPISVTFANDGDTAALWEAQVRGVKDLTMLAFGTGLGGGAVQNGRMFRGVLPSAELGHIYVPHGPICGEHLPPCSCGKFYHAEAYASLWGLAQAIAALSDDHRFSSHPLIASTEAALARAKKVRALVNKNDEVARHLFFWQADRIGDVCAAVTHIYGSPLIAIGGGWGEIEDERIREELLATIRKRFEEQVMSPVYRTVKIEWAESGDDAGALGAAEMARLST